MKSITRVIAVTGIRSEYDILFPIIKKINNDNQFCLKGSCFRCTFIRLAR